MSLFGALSSGVSGLQSQSSAMGAISDNITNLSTIGYKNTKVSFQTLVTKQTSTTLFSAGGVQSRPRQLNGVQGLLQATSSQTDISIAGNGFFVVNEAAKPTIANEFLYSRAGSFFQDNEGFLRNTAGFYLQAWPTNASGTVVPANTSLSVPNQNIVSTDYLATVNLNRVGGTAAATSTIGIGVNLPSSDTAGKTHRTDVQFFDSLGNAHSISFSYTKTGVENQWDLGITPPPGTAALTIEDSSGKAYASRGQLEFTARPANGATVVIEARTYEFDSDVVPSITSGNIRVDTSTSTSLASDVSALVTAVTTNDSDFDSVNNRIKINPDSSTFIIFEDDGTGNLTSGVAGFVIDPTGLLDTNGSNVTKQTSSFTVRKVTTDFTDYQQFRFAGLPANNDEMTINGKTYTFLTAEADDSTGADTQISIDGGSTVATMLADLEAAIEKQDAQFAIGANTATSVRVREANDSGANDTIILPVLTKGSYTVIFSTGFTNVPKEPDTTATYSAGAANAFTVQKKNAIIFNSDGLPSAFNVAEIEIRDFDNGAADMDDDPSNSKQMTIDFGTVGQADGVTQFGAQFTPVFITQNGSQFGTFAGVTIDVNGLVTALFDNGETRPVFQIPIATFTNPEGLESRSGNVWNQTEASGDFTLREADNGPAGQVNQSALEQSTVDIGAEFTDMIIVQRAFSAATKIISTADEMLEELLRTKR